MAETLVKICGLQDVEVLKSMLHLPLDYIGFVFAPSRRKVSIERAAELIAELPNWKTGEIPKAAGVFVNPELDELNELLSVVHLDVIQLHGQESPAFASRFAKLIHRFRYGRHCPLLIKSGIKLKMNIPWKITKLQ